MPEKMIEPSRLKALKTLKARHGDDYFEKLAASPHKRGFSDPEVARKAGKKSAEVRRKNAKNKS